jgi:hypothetical protein
MFGFINVYALRKKLTELTVLLPYFKFLLTLATIAMIALSSTTSQAGEFKGVVGIGWDMLGGDTVVTGTCTACGTPEQKANNGLAFNVGGVMINDSYETQATIGYKYGSPVGENGTIKWEAIPIEIIQFYRTSNMRIGLGFIYQINPRLVVNVPGLNYTKDYDNAFGTLVQLGWAPAGESYTIELRYSAMMYKQNSSANPQEVDGNVLGIYSNYYF